MIDPKQSTKINDEVLAERLRAHIKHQANSAEEQSWTSPNFLTILLEEVGELAKAINEYRVITNQPHKLGRELRAELIQVSAMAQAWIVAIDEVFNV